jgi:peptidoglycan/LPS O-acetylase OafA/YrhL
MSFHLDRHSIRLQSLRGLAALAVAVGHAFTLMPNGRIDESSFVLRPSNALLAAGHVLIQPNTAVIVFYVLSGFVLGEAFRRRRSSERLLHMLAFTVRRLWRLVPVMWLSIFLSAAVFAVVPHGPYSGVTTWFNNEINVDLSASAMLANLAGLSHSINSVLWSIQIELVMIVLLPLMVFVCNRTSLAADYAIFWGLCVVSIFAWDQLWYSALFAYCFYLGVMLPKVMSDPLAPRLFGNGIGVTVSLVLLLPIEFLMLTHRLSMPYKFIADSLISFHLIAFLMLRSDCKEASLLDRPFLVWIGDVSYSFYCYAMSVLILLGSLIFMTLPASWLASNLLATVVVVAAGTSCIVISLVLAHFSFEHIEKPGMRIGTSWSKWIEVGTIRPVWRARQENGFVEQSDKIAGAQMLRGPSGK